MAHPHRQRATTHQSLASRLLEELAQAAEVGASRFGIVRERRQHHEALDVHGLVAAELLEGREEVRLVQPELRRLLAEVDLDQHRQLPPRLLRPPLEPLGEGDVVDGVHGVEQLGRAPALVALDVPDHVPAQAGRAQVVQSDDLAFGFLDLVLAEVAEAGGEGLAHRFRGLGLADRDEGDLVGRTPGTRRRPGDLLPNGGDAAGDHVTSWA